MRSNLLYDIGQALSDRFYLERGSFDHRCCQSVKELRSQFPGLPSPLHTEGLQQVLAEIPTADLDKWLTKPKRRKASFKDRPN